MTFQEFIAHLGFDSSLGFWGLVAFLMSWGIELIPKIKWSPWTAIFKWIGSKFNDRFDKRFDELDQKFDEHLDCLEEQVGEVRSRLDEHIKGQELKDLQDTRRDILEFANSCMNKRKHTKEQFDFVITQCDEYEKYISENDVKNGIVESAIREIRRLYDKCIQENSFLKESED